MKTTTANVKYKQRLLCVRVLLFLSTFIQLVGWVILFNILYISVPSCKFLVDDLSLEGILPGSSLILFGISDSFVIVCLFYIDFPVLLISWCALLAIASGLWIFFYPDSYWLLAWSALLMLISVSLASVCAVTLKSTYDALLSEVPDLLLRYGLEKDNFFLK